MARDRQRAKQRKQRRAARQQPRTQGPLAVESRSTVEPPDPVDEASADAELAKEALGGAADVDPLGRRAEPARVYEDEIDGDAEISDRDGSRDELEEADELGVSVGGPSSRSRGARSHAGAELPGHGNRFVNFLRACVAELRRVQWPDRRQVFQATGVVLGFVIIAGGYLGVIDLVAQKIVNAIL